MLAAIGMEAFAERARHELLSAFECVMASPFGRAKMRYLTVALLARRPRP